MAPNLNYLFEIDTIALTFYHLCDKYMSAN